MRYWTRWIGIGLVLAVIGGALAASSVQGQDGNTLRGEAFTIANASGLARTINVAGFPVVAVQNPFFQDLGVNGRRCVTCHEPTTNMTVTPDSLRVRFELTRGTDPIFRPNDGSNSPLADTSSVGARRDAYSMLLTKGVIRVGISVPTTAEFELLAVDDPYGYAGHNTNGNELSLFRRPLPATNLDFLSTVMWDGRETFEKGAPSAIHFDLADQSNAATQGHAQRPTPLDEATRDEIVAYEVGNYTAQIVDSSAGDLRAAGAQGGPEMLSDRTFTFGGNDPLGCDPTAATCTGSNPNFSPIVFTEYSAWTRFRDGARAAVARGEDLFNTLAIPIAAVSGINDDFGGPGDFNVPIIGTCTTCHDTPHAGDHSVPAPLDIGVAEPPVPLAKGGDGVHSRFGLPVGDMPVYTFRNKTTGDIKVVTDPGRALITGLWKDVGRFKGPILRGLAGRAPYFHNGSAASLRDVVNFYDVRFGLGLTDAQKSDLVAFLGTL